MSDGTWLAWVWLVLCGAWVIHLLTTGHIIYYME